jgi:hypothetical protein
MNGLSLESPDFDKVMKPGGVTGKDNPNIVQAVDKLEQSQVHSRKDQMSRHRCNLISLCLSSHAPRCCSFSSTIQKLSP